MSQTNINHKRIMIDNNYNNHYNFVNPNKRKCVKTTVYSGQSRNVSKVQTLKSLCNDVLLDLMINNTETLSNIITKPKQFDLIKPLLDKFNANQLNELEKYNPKLIYLTDELWHQLCDNAFPANNRCNGKLKYETWRQCYQRLTKDMHTKITSSASVIKIKAQKDKERNERILIAAIPNSIKDDVIKTRKRENTVNNRPKVAPLMQKCLSMRKRFIKR